MDDDDPLKRLLDELLDAHYRLQTVDRTANERRSYSRGRRRRTIAISAAILALSASAAAAIVVATRPSAPLSGALPRELFGSRYTLGVTPDLRAGRAGWCVALLDIRTSASVLPNPATCGSTGSGPLIARGGIETLSPTTATVEGWLLYAIVDKSVRALRTPDGMRILPISSGSLPSGWRAAVTVTTKPKTSHSIATLTPLDASGRQLSTRLANVIVLPTRAIAPSHAPASGCRITVQSLQGLRVLAAHTLRGPLPGSLTAAPGFLSCYSISLDFRGVPSRAALLVNSQHPGQRPPAITGTTPLRGHPDIEAEPNSVGGTSGAPVQRLVARRVGTSWLVLQTSASTNAAVALLHDLVARTGD